MLKHAYLIMTYNNFRLLERLIELLDSENNDFYIHVDKKQEVNVDTLIQYKAKKSKVIFTDRVAVNWGSISELRGTLILMETAYKNGPYDYYHFMQGADMPIKPLSYINQFFETNNGKEFLNIDPKWTEYGDYRFNRHHFFMDNVYYRNSRLRQIFRVLVARTEGIFHISRGKEKVYVGSAMWILTGRAITTLLDKKDYILRRAENTFIPVEMIYHTLLMQDENFVNSLYKYNEPGDNLYLIDWSRGQAKNSPHLYTIQDFDMLINSAPDMLFARKFNDSTDCDIIEKLYGALREKETQM